MSSYCCSSLHLLQSHYTSPVQFSFAFGPDVIPCGWLGLKQQLTKLTKFFCLFYAHVDAVVHFLVFSQILQVQTFLFSVLSFCCSNQEFLQWSSFLSCAKDLTGCFSHYRVEGGDHWIHVCIFNFMMVRGANFLPIIAGKVSNTLGSFGFSRSNLSLECFGLLIRFRRRWKVICKSWSLPMSAPGKLRVLAMFTLDRKRLLTRM